MLTSKERFCRAVEHKSGERVPITFDAEAEVYEALHEYLGTGSKEELFDKLNVDTWMILPGDFIYPKEELGNQEKESIWGFRTRSVRYPQGVYEQLCHSPLAGRDEISDIEGYNWPGGDALDFSHFEKEAAEHSDRAVIGVFTWGAFHLATFLRGMEDLMSDFALRQDYAEYLFRSISERMVVFLERMLEFHGEGIDVVYMADDYCSQRAPLFSPGLFERFVMPYLSEVVRLAHGKNKKFLLHVCGSVRALLPMIIEAGVDILEPIQIRAEGMEPVGLKRDFGRDICFYGGLDIQEVLCNGGGIEVREEVKRLIDVLGKGGGYVFGPGHTYIQADAPVENILTMYETAVSYGACPE